MTDTLRIQSTEVLVDGPTSAPVLLMLHGWPDTRALWQPQVDALQGRFRCVRFTWPGFDGVRPTAEPTLDGFVGLVHAVLQATSPNSPVHLLMHDWGCIYGYEYLARHPERVAKVVAIDIGDYNSSALVASLTLKQKLFTVGYQLGLSGLWAMADKLGTVGFANRVTRAVAKGFRAPAAAEDIHWRMNQPYAMTWFGAAGGFKQAAKLREPSHPILYFYGLKKPFQFQSPRWLEAIAKRGDGSQAFAMNTGHWVMLQAAAEVNQRVAEFLDPPRLS